MSLNKKQKTGQSVATTSSYNLTDDLSFLNEIETARVKVIQDKAKEANCDTQKGLTKVQFAKKFNEWITDLCNNPEVKIESAEEFYKAREDEHGLRTCLLLYPPSLKGEPFYPGQYGHKKVPWWDIGNEPFSWKVHGKRDLTYTIPMLSSLDPNLLTVPFILANLQDCLKNDNCPEFMIKRPLVTSTNKCVTIKVALVEKSNEYETQKFVVVQSDDPSAIPIEKILTISTNNY